MKKAIKKSAAERASAGAAGAGLKGAMARGAKRQRDLAEEGEALQRQAQRMLKPGGCRAFMRRELADKFPGIVEGFVKAAKTGSVPHVKLATELLKPTRKSSPRRKRTVTELLDKLRRNMPFEEPAESMRWPTAGDPEGMEP